MKQVFRRARLILASLALALAALVGALVTDPDHGSELVGFSASELSTAQARDAAPEGGYADPVEPRSPTYRGTTGAFLDSIGVVTHLHFVDTAYGRQELVFKRLDELGVRHIREGVPVGSEHLEKGLREAARHGLRGTLVSDISVPAEEGVAASFAVMGEQVEAFEGPNELDVYGPRDWRERLHEYLPALRAAVHARRPGDRIVGPSFADTGYYNDFDFDTYSVASFHPFTGALPPEPTLGDKLDGYFEAAPAKPVAFTETGFHNALAATVGHPPASEGAAAVYLLRSLLWAFTERIERTFVHELLDMKPDPRKIDPEQNFGLLRHDFSRKPAFLAVRNLIRVLRRSPGGARRAAPVPSIKASEPVERLMLRRPDGSRVLALWRETSIWDRDNRRKIVPKRLVVKLRWPRAARKLSVVRPSSSSRPKRSLRVARNLRLKLRGDVVLVSYR
jgi:hypothetical protein